MEEFNEELEGKKFKTEPKNKRSHFRMWKAVCVFMLILLVVWGVEQFIEYKYPDSKIATTTNSLEEKADSLVDRNQERTKVPGNVREFSNFVQNTSSTEKPDYKYCKEGFLKLADALESVVLEGKLGNKGVGKAISDLRSMANSIDKNSDKDQLVEGFDQAFFAVSNVQKKNYPKEGRYSIKIKKALETISDDESQKIQNNDMQDFFEESSNAVDAFANEKVSEEVNN